MPVTIGTIRTRIRTQLNEATQRFYPDAPGSGLIGWYSDGAAAQHRIVIEMARQQKKLTMLAHPYLRRFATRALINITEGVQLYTLPANFLEPIDVGVADAAGLDEKAASYMDSSQDWFIRNLPQLQPVFDKPTWSLQIDPADGLVKLQLFVFGNKTLPNAPLQVRLYYYRDVLRIVDFDPAANVDVDDPYNEGPVWYAVGSAYAKRGGDASPYFGMATLKAQSILGPPEAGAATGVTKQAEGATMQVSAGESRDGS